MIKNVWLLTKISIGNYIENMNIFDMEKRKINKKSSFFWMLIILLIALIFISNQILDELNRLNSIDIFLNVYLLFVFIIMTIQAVLLTTNVMYYAKDLDDFMTLPVKPKEIFFAKIGTILSILYATEIFIMLIPLILYGIKIHTGFLYYFNLIPVIILFPIFTVIIISLMNLIIMKIIKGIKNENAIQFIMSILLILIISITEYFFVKSVVSQDITLQKMWISLNDLSIVINRSLVIVNPIIDIIKPNHIFLNLCYILLIYMVGIIVLMGMANKYYLNILLNRIKYNTKIEKKQDNLEKRGKRRGAKLAYIINEIRFLKGNILFLLQSIIPVVIVMVCITAITILLKTRLINTNQEIAEFFNQLYLNTEGFGAILIALQVIMSFTKYSIIAVSKEGGNAIFIKYIPIKLYTQFWLKNIVQIVINTIVIVIFLVLLKYVIPTISIWYIILIFLDAIIMNVINSSLMLMKDLRKPFLDWTTEYQVIKQNANTMFQYVVTVIFTLICLYFMSLFKNVNLNISIMVSTIFLLLILLGLNRYIKLKADKLFEKIQ